MNFAELRFWGWLAAGLAVILLFRPLGLKWFGADASRYDRRSLLVLSFFLLACVSWVTVIIFAVVAAGTYVALRWLVRHPTTRHRYYLALVIPCQLLPLGYYKYAHFAVNQVMGFEFSVLFHVVIPVGISFYTFQMVAFVIDTLGYRKPVPPFLDFLNFAAFFPQIVAGPIERRADLLPQMERFRFRWNAGEVDQGVSWIVLGLFFKLCLADNMAAYFYGESLTNPYLIWLDNFLFGFRIYYDFAGYSLVAIGLGRWLGVRLTLNFRSPYAAASIADFWRRWHITLSYWFRDYVYVPLGGGRTPRWWLNVMIVFVVSGIWHGAGWNFVLWGGMHGVFLVVNRLLGSKLRLPVAVSWGLTFMAAMVAWLGFYETRTAELWMKLQTLATPQAYRWEAVREVLAVLSPSSLWATACFLGLVALVLGMEWRSIRNDQEPYRLLRRPAVLVVLVVLTVWLAPGGNNAFIYFAF